METGLAQRTTVSWSHYGFHEYLLVANPTGEAREKIKAEKQAFSALFGNKPVTSTPHITIANFLAREAMEDTITRYIQRISEQHTAFPVMLNNYSGYPPNTIYVRVQDPQPFKQIAKDLKAVAEYINSCSCPTPTFIANPHVSIARSIPEDIYYKALMEYSQKSFHETFLVHDIVLLRRVSQYESWKTLNVFRLRPSTNLYN